MGMQLRDVWWTWHDNPDVEGVASRLWLATTDTTSWAAVDWDGTSEDRFTVWQHGPRRLWNEAEIAYAWWTMHDRPGPERFGLTVTATGESTWLDDSDQPVPLIGRPQDRPVCAPNSVAYGRGLTSCSPGHPGSRSRRRPSLG